MTRKKGDRRKTNSLFCSKPINRVHKMTVYKTLEIEYADMAGWYDTFWAGYLQKALQLPLQLLQDFLMRLPAAETNEYKGEETTTQPVVVVDIACGTGEYIQRAAAAIIASKKSPTTKINFWGVEPSKAMLDQAESKQQHQCNGNTNMNINWIQSSAENLPLQAIPPADIISCTNAFHFFRHKTLSLKQMYSLLKSNDDGGSGKLIITDWCADYLIVRLYHLLELFRWNILGWHSEWYPAPLTSPTLQKLVQDAGFTNVQITTYTIRFWMIVLWGMQTITAEKKGMKQQI